MRHAMWMGPRGYEQWVPMPAISPGYTRSSWGSTSSLLNGGATIRQSKTAHNVYAFEWNNGRRDDIAPVRDMAEGLWDTGPGPTLIYFIDPVEADRNLMPAHWAAPAVTAEDGPSLLRGNRPTAALLAASGWGLPARAAVFGAGGQQRSVYVPIPPGFRAHFGWVGSGAGQVLLRQATATGANGTQTPAPLGDGGAWTNASVDRASDVIGVEVALAGTGAVTVRAMTLQVLPIGRSPRTNVRWWAGRGHSGCQFQEKAGLVPLSVPLDLEAASATLEETGAWL